MAFTDQVAKHAGVSPSTVSLVVNGKGRVSPATRRRVQQAIDRLGHLARRSVTRRRNFEIAAIYCRDAVHNGIASQFTHHLLEGIRQQITSAGGHMSLFQGQPHVREDIFLRQRLRAGGIDGVILMGPGRRDGYIDCLLSQRTPLVIINRHAEFNEFSTVSVDYFGGGRLGVEHLLSLGHQRIALLFSSRRHWPGKPIVAGASEALRKAKLKPALTLTVDASRSPADLARRVLDSGATAVFSGDYTCVDLLQAFDALGVSVPKDVSVLGFDNLDLRAPTGKRLTTVGYNKQRIGRLAAAVAMRLSRRKAALKQMALSVRVTLVQGQTTAQAKATKALADAS